MPRSNITYEFSRPQLLERALTHRSKSGENNERLEFLGDSVLNFVVAQRLYELLPEASEGHLSRLRASLVKGSTLAEIAADLDLGKELRLGSGELKSGGHRRDSILADAVEALLGAILLDGGFEAVQDYILGLWRSRFEDLPGEESLKDPKTRLQEYLQSRGNPLPVYEVLVVSGEPHNQTFKVECRIQALEIKTEGVAGSRRRAEQEAASFALEAIHGS